MECRMLKRRLELLGALFCFLVIHSMVLLLRLWRRLFWSSALSPLSPLLGKFGLAFLETEFREKQTQMAAEVSPFTLRNLALLKCHCTVFRCHKYTPLQWTCLYVRLLKEAGRLCLFFPLFHDVLRTTTRSSLDVFSPRRLETKIH